MTYLRTAAMALLAATTLVTSSPVAALSGRPANRQQQGQVDAAALVGRWGDNGDCTKDVVFRANGTFRTFNGGEGRWSLNGDRLVLAGGGGDMPLRVRWGGPNQLIITNPDGSVGTSQRC
jgi:hypothetical protein